MRVKIIRQPVGSVNGLNLSLYKSNRVYDLPSDLGSYLVASGFARLEMRRADKLPGALGFERRKADVRNADVEKDDMLNG
jgi:hypothetical protein